MATGRGLLTGLVTGFILLILLTLSAGYRESPPKRVTVIDDLTQGQECERSRYYCAKGCEPTDPNSPESPLPPGDVVPDDLQPLDEYPEYPLWGPYIEAIQTTVTPVTLYSNEINGVTTDLDLKYDTPFKLSGDGLWNLDTWFSKYADGSGAKTNLRENTLTQRQQDKTMRPESRFGFKDLDQGADLTSGADYDQYKYICGEVKKGDSPNPDFALVKRKRAATRGCARVTIKDRGSSEPKTVQFDSVTPTPVELFLGEKNKVTSDVAVTFNEENTNPDVAGEGLWELSTWYSKDEDGEGRVTNLVPEALSEQQANKPVDNFNPFTFEDVAADVDLRDKEGCGKYRYFCAQIKKGSPRPDYQQVGKSRASRTGCAPVTCRLRDNPDDEGNPGDRDGPDRDRDPKDRDPKDRDDRERERERNRERKIEVVHTSTTPVTLYRNEVNDVTTDVAIAFDTEVYIQGTDLWEMSIWFSKQRDGSGAKTNLREATLSPRQQDKKVKPDKPLLYSELPQQVDLSDGTGCGKYRYICSELRKNDPNPDFKLTDRKKLSRRGCAQVTCKDRGDDSTPTVQFAAVQPNPVTIYIGEKTPVTTDVDVKFKQANTDPNTAGIDLWQMSLWFSKKADGSGRVSDFVETSLNEAQGEMGVDFQNFVFEGLGAKADLRNLLGCGKHKYICARVRKDSPEPDYELIGKSLAARTGCAKVRCESRSLPEQKLELVATTPTPVTLYKNERNPVTTDVTVDFEADYPVSGKKLWQMSLWFSKSPLGDGKKVNLRESALSGSQRSQPIDIEQSLVFEGLPQSVDLSNGDGCGKYRYICAEIRKLEPEPPFEYTLKRKLSPKGCAKVSCIDRKKMTPTVEFQRVQPTPVTLTVGENNQVSTDVTVEFNPRTTDEDVSGKGLWGMAVWFSKSKDGQGSSVGFVESTLSKTQAKQAVAFGGDFEFLGLEMSVDLTDAIGCGKYRFICARIRKGDPLPDYDLVGKKSVTGCAPVKCMRGEEEEEEPLVIVSTTITPVILYAGEQINVFPDVTVNFRGEEGVSGSNLWQMSIWFGKKGDGSGKKTGLTESTLTQSQKDQTLDISQDLIFREIEKSADLRESDGCGKYKYICAEIRKDNPSPSFKYEKKRPSSVRGCAKTSCTVREQPDPTVKFASTQPTGVTIYEEELNVVNTDVVVTFDESETDPTVAGTRLWQMQLWFSKAANGAGSSIGTIESALSGEDGEQPVSFSDFSFDGLEARADLTKAGCGKYKFICARVRKDKPDPSYKLVGKDPSQTTGCAPVECLRGRDPTVQFASLSTTPVTVYEETLTAVTTTVSVSFEEDRTDLVSGSSLWQVDLWFSKSNDGRGSSSDEAENVLSVTQAAKTVNFNRFVFEDLEISADLTPEERGCGKYRFICAQIRRDDPEPTYKLLGKDRTTSTGCAPVRCDKSQVPTVQFASVSNTPVTVYEEQRTTVQSTVSVTFDRENTNPEVAGSGLWQLRVWFSKNEDGQGSSIDVTESALSSAQSAKAVNFNSFVFEDVEATADLTAAGCGKYRYICAQIRRDNPEPDYKVVGKSPAVTVGCSPVSCERLVVPEVTVTSVRNTPISLLEGEDNQVGTDVTVTFDRSSDEISGSNLWRVETWYSKAADGSGAKVGYSKNGLTSSQSSEGVGRSYRINFRNVAANADLSSAGCGKYLHVCARIKKGEPDTDFILQDNGPDSITGCSPVECGSATPPTPHITPTRLTVTSTQVEVGRQETIDIDVSVFFDPSNTDDVSGSNNWRIIVWLSDDSTGVGGSRIAETDETISFAQKDMSLRSAGPLNFRNVAVDMNLSTVRCKYVTHVCARMKKASPDPDYTMSPKSVTGCAPCRCS